MSIVDTGWLCTCGCIVIVYALEEDKLEVMCPVCGAEMDREEEVRAQLKEHDHGQETTESGQREQATLFDEGEPNDPRAEA